MKNLVNFIKYNNAVPITLSVVLLGAGSAFAASPEVRDAAAAAVLSQNQQVVSVDNTYIVSKDLAHYSPKVTIDAVTEDAENYYVAYTFSTIDLDNFVWKDVVKKDTMTVSKPDLGQYGDLGVYVTRQFRQIIDRERQHLSEVQEAERKHVSQAVVATTYGGLIGKFLDASQETLPGYTPVVAAPEEQRVFSQGMGPNIDGRAPRGPAPEGGSGGQLGGMQGDPNTAHQIPTAGAQVQIQVLGNNPARLALRSSYVDLGAYLYDPFATNVGLHTYLNGVETASPAIDTSTSSVQIIDYKATDLKGNVVSARRVVLVGDAQDPGGEVSTSPEVQAPTDSKGQVESMQGGGPTTTTAPAPAATSTEPATPDTPPLTSTTTPPATSSSPAAVEPDISTSSATTTP